MKRPTISVCMATFNGAEFVREQLCSILIQIPDDAEVVVVDDASTDSTNDVIQSLNDHRIRLVRLPVNGGYVRAFERAITEAKGEAIFLSDQDDIWLPGRVDTMLDALAGGEVVASNLGLLPDGRPMRHPLSRRPWRLRERDSRNPIKNIASLMIGSALYYGCAMAFSRSIVNTILPVPRFVTESHDQWIALCGLARSSMVHVEEVTVLRRIHSTNASASRTRPVWKVLRSRLMFLREVPLAFRRATARARIEDSS